VAVQITEPSKPSPPTGTHGKTRVNNYILRGVGIDLFHRDVRIQLWKKSTFGFMSLFLARKLVMYRSGLVALFNAGITWVILIIAPLGLFSVIVCTVGVFISSLAVGWVCDRSLLQMLESSYREVMSANRESENIDAASRHYLDIRQGEERKQK
jgi:hypothetical protein